MRKVKKIKIPDVVIGYQDKIVETEEEIFAPEDSVLAIVETKHPSKDVNQGILQSIRYMSLVKCNICFSTNFKDVIAFKVEDYHNNIDQKSFGKKINSDTVTMTVDYILEVIAGAISLTKMAYNDRTLISVLEGPVKEIFEYSKKIY